MMKIFNKILWGIKPPENKSDIWFDGDVFKIYRKGDWEAITIEIDAASKLADVIKNINDVYQTKLTEGDGILLEDSKISVRRMFQVVSELPKTGEYNTIYLLVENNKEIGSYIYVNNEWMSLVSTIEIDKNLNIYSTNPVENKAVTKKIESLDVVRIVEGGVSGLESGNFRDGSVGSAISSDHAFTGVTLTREHVGCTIQGVKWIHKGGLILFPNFRVNTSCTINLRNGYGDIGSIKMYYKDITSIDIDIILPNEHITLMKNSNVFLPENVNTVLTNKLAYYQIVGIYNNGFDVDSFAPYFQFDLTRDIRELYFKNGDWKKVLIEDNVKTINGENILGEGNIEISGYDDTEIKENLEQIGTLAYEAAMRSSRNEQSITEVRESIANISPAPMVSVTYSELVDLRNNGGLIAGMQYRITDYVTTTAQENTQSAGHPFDVIVTADSNNALNEVARACLHEGDDYFLNEAPKLEAWKIWYCLDNDTDRFAWADAENGKGVIYRMIDEWNNDLPYDFKNIMFKRYELNAPELYEASGKDEYWMVKLSENIRENFNAGCKAFIWSGIQERSSRIWEDDQGEIMSDPAGGWCFFYTFSDGSDNSLDASLTGTCCDNVMLNSYRLPNNVFFGGGENYGNRFGSGCCNNSISFDCSYNTFGSDCCENCFEPAFYYNTFGNRCSHNSFGFSCQYNNLGTRFNYNSLGDGCTNNSFISGSEYNGLGMYCTYNTFDNNCMYNTLGNNCAYNSFGNGCAYISFKDIDGFATFSRCTFDSSVRSFEIYHDVTHHEYGNHKYIHVYSGVTGFVEIRDADRNYETCYALDKSGNVHEFCIMDFENS